MQYKQCGKKNMHDSASCIQSCIVQSTAATELEEIFQFFPPGTFFLDVHANS